MGTILKEQKKHHWSVKFSVALVGAVGGGLLAVSQFFTPLIADNPKYQVILFTGFGIVFGGAGLYYGCMYPAKTSSYKQRKFWAYADLAWLILSLFTIGKILAPVEKVLTRDDFKITQEKLYRRNLITHIYQAQDTLCPTAALDKPVCRDLKRMEREALLPGLEAFSAQAIANILERHCQNTNCIEPLQSVQRSSNALLSLYNPQPVVVKKEDQTLMASVIKNVDDLQKAWLNDIALIYFNLALLIAAFGVRLGRTGAEIKRISLEEAASKSEHDQAQTGTPPMSGGPAEASDAAAIANESPQLSAELGTADMQGAAKAKMEAGKDHQG